MRKKEMKQKSRNRVVGGLLALCLVTVFGFTSFVVAQGGFSEIQSLTELAKVTSEGNFGKAIDYLQGLSFGEANFGATAVATSTANYTNTNKLALQESLRFQRDEISDLANGHEIVFVSVDFADATNTLATIQNTTGERINILPSTHIVLDGVLAATAMSLGAGTSSAGFINAADMFPTG